MSSYVTPRDTLRDALDAFVKATGVSYDAVVEIVKEELDDLTDSGRTVPAREGNT